jgi:hypothetical protein
MKIYVNHEIATDMILDFTARFINKSFKLVDLPVIDVYAFVLADTYIHFMDEFDDVPKALDIAIARAECFAKDNFTHFVAENKDVDIRW